MIALTGCGGGGAAVDKLREGHPNVIDVIRSGAVDLVVNTVSGNGSAREAGPVTLRDGYEIRRASVERRIPCLTSLDTARSLVQALRHVRHNPRWQVATLTEYRSMGIPESAMP